MTVRVFLLDDHQIVREGVRRLVEADGDLEVVGEAASAAEALARIGASHPDVAVLDVRLPDGDGISVCREIRSRHPQVACLMLTSFADDEALAQAVMAGAGGYVLKQIQGQRAGVVGAGRGRRALPHRRRHHPAGARPAATEPRGEPGPRAPHAARSGRSSS